MYRSRCVWSHTNAGGIYPTRPLQHVTHTFQKVVPSIIDHPRVSTVGVRCISNTSETSLKRNPLRQSNHNHNHKQQITSKLRVSKALQSSAAATELKLPHALPFTDFLTDSFGRHHTYLRISLTESCNLRCTYCMPAEGVDRQPRSQLLSTDEIVRLAELFVSQGVEKIRLTGGEPTVRKDFVQLCERLGKIEGLKGLALTSNGIALEKMLPALKDAGVTQINISLDTLVAPKYHLITRRPALKRVLSCIDAALAMDFPNRLKLNCVVIKGFNDDEVNDFVEFTRTRDIDIRFIEYMPFGGNKWDDKKFISYTSLLEEIGSKYIDILRLQDHPNDTSKAYKVDGHEGQIGFITSMSDHFCGTCNRLRITADGNLKVCLFGNAEVSLRDAIRDGENDENLGELIGAAVRRKKSQHAGMYALSRSENRPMILIGG
ncbi:molybdenum cofactor biosynthesis protein A [Sphaeroforma arctica JP610]|uniref:GTP 3',8-cyclase n=1 Tax=Sphaeroforma arctica JP610 TaxID=667725 RepID=A0A0L0G3M7_9EUKA|nr:molybdenum cofactor biosynthesis protein A [Sphaeroforma arctica JP610]KNC83650.1 molybdenum cofactor biosynthesis protein A [Sphaeroforma arctica JP610]|eukprot:XP_014157552.1 molybdenum cofactor biosynthesis protein A [Sphaeroforma arctica JP610]